MDEFNNYPVYKGLQKPLEFMGIRGKFIYIFIKQKLGLHAKKRYKGIVHYAGLFEY